MNDPLMQLLDGLPSAHLDPVRGHRIHARCHMALARERRRMTPSESIARRWPPIVVGLGGLYLSVILQQVVALYKVL